MADIRCPICAEPIDMDEIHEAVTERYGVKQFNPKGKFDEKLYSKAYYTVFDEFKSLGCVALGFSPCQATTLGRATVLSITYATLGDDVDAIASTLEDATKAGIFE